MTDNFIEDAAKALYEQLHLHHPWDNLIEADKELWRKRARALLPIFAKHMTSDKAVKAFDEGFREAVGTGKAVDAGITAALKTLEG